MAEKAKKKDNKNLIIGICTAILVVIIVVVAVIFTSKGSVGNLNDAYFVSDDTKYVLTVDGDMSEDEDVEISPVKTHIVYTYSGDTITGMTTYMEFADATTAKSALETYKSMDDQTGVKNLSVNGKYVVIEMTEDQYADLTASDVKEQIEFMEMLQNMDIDEDENIEDCVDEDCIIDETDAEEDDGTE